MTGAELRQRFLQHFTSRDHLELPSASLIPVRDPTTLFISAGMHPLKPYFQGVSRPPAPRLTSAQKCFRTPDLEEVGKTDRHGTFFEMLGNFAPTGDYFKETAIPLAWELVTEGLKMPKDRLRVTIHPTDDEADGHWRSKTDVRPDWIYRNQDNWWAAGDTGPCGPDSEIWWDRGVEHGCGQPDCEPDHCERFLEFWNLVFMQYDRQPDGTLQPLPKPGIDTGMGLERISAIQQAVETIFDIDLYRPIMEFVGQNSEHPAERSKRVITDHLRGMTFVIGDGVLPSNEGRGYVLRRLIRGAALHARKVGLRKPLSAGVDTVVEVMRDRYPELVEQAPHIREVVDGEAQRFNRTLEQGLELFEGVVAKHPKLIPGQEAFRLHDTFGFPIELTRDLAQERGIEVDQEGFQSAMAAQRERSRTMTGQRWPNAAELPAGEFVGYHQEELETRLTGLRMGGQNVSRAAEGDQVEVFLEGTPFYAESGGQIGDTGIVSGPHGRVRVEDTQRPAEGVIAHLGTVVVGVLQVGEQVTALVDRPRRRQIARHHSATHLLHKALRETLGEQAIQKGSWVGPDHTTFDFAFNRALTPEELDRVSRRISEQARAALPFHESYRSYKEAVEAGAMHLFEEKYGDTVRVVCFGDWTCELCGGTHVQNSADVGATVILSESSVAAGVRRVDLVAGEAADELIRRRLAQQGELARSLGVPPDQLTRRVTELRSELKEKDKTIASLREEVRRARVQGSEGGPRKVEARVPLLMETVPADGDDDLRGYADRYLEALGGTGVVAVVGGERFVIKVSRDLDINAKELTGHFGRGGGSPSLAQGRMTKAPDEAFKELAEALR
ncbi:MAG TPA: alanine--tRNA ligase [Candidatus Dormibacteraeota bacterium]